MTKSCKMHAPIRCKKVLWTLQYCNSGSWESLQLCMTDKQKSSHPPCCLTWSNPVRYMCKPSHQSSHTRWTTPVRCMWYSQMQGSWGRHMLRQSSNCYARCHGQGCCITVLAACCDAPDNSMLWCTWKPHESHKAVCGAKLDEMGKMWQKLQCLCCAPTMFSCLLWCKAKLLHLVIL